MSDNGNNDSGDKPLRIVEFHARNIMAIKAMDIYPENKDIVVLTGKNRQGKSTIIRAIWAALGGKEFIPDEAIRRGEKESNIYLDLGDFFVTLKITAKKEYLKVKIKNGMETSSPHKFLNSRLADLAHNPLEFMRLKSVEQIKIVQGLFPLDVRAAEVERIAGFAAKIFSCEDNKVLYLDNVHKALFEERTENNREIIRLEKVIESIQIPRYLEDLKPVSISNLVSEKEALEKHKWDNDNTRNVAEKTCFDIEIMRKRIISKDSEISILEAKLAAEKQERSILVQNVSDMQDSYFEIADKIENFIDPDFTDINRRIAEVDKHNEQANKVAQNKATKKESQSALDKARSDSKKLTSQIEQLKAYKLRLIEQAKLPLSGLGFENGRVTYNGLPLDQASGREQIEISCAICLAQHPKIGIITIDVGWSDLDEDGKWVVREFARKTGAQIWVTQVREEPGQEGFHIVAGELSAVDGVQVAENCEEVD